MVRGVLRIIQNRLRRRARVKRSAPTEEMVRGVSRNMQDRLRRRARAKCSAPTKEMESGVLQNKQYMLRSRGLVEHSEPTDGEIPVSQTLFVGNVSRHCRTRDVLQLFEPFGVISWVRCATDEQGRPKGFFHVCFAEEKAAVKAFESRNNLRLKGQSFLCNIHQESEYEEFPGIVLLVRNFPFTTFEQARNSLENKFRTCGVIRDVYLPRKLNGPAMPGTAFIELENVDAVKEAIKLRGRGPNELKVHELIYPYISLKVKNEGGYGGIYGYRDSKGKFRFRPDPELGFGPSALNV